MWVKHPNSRHKTQKKLGSINYPADPKTCKLSVFEARPAEQPSHLKSLKSLKSLVSCQSLWWHSFWGWTSVVWVNMLPLGPWEASLSRGQVAFVAVEHNLSSDWGHTVMVPKLLPCPSSDRSQNHPSQLWAWSSLQTIPQITICIGGIDHSQMGSFCLGENVKDRPLLERCNSLYARGFLLFYLHFSWFSHRIPSFRRQLDLPARAFCAGIHLREKHRSQQDG